MNRLERRVRVIDDIYQVEELSQEEVNTTIFMRRMDDMEKDALVDISKTVDVAKLLLKLKAPEYPSVDAIDVLRRQALDGQLRAMQDASSYGQGFMQQQYVPYGAARQGLGGLLGGVFR